MADSDSIKLCECGCGKPAPIATKTERKRGYIEGRPRRFLKGHHNMGRPVPHPPTHGLSGSPEHQSWRGMVERCTNPRSPTYANYGARGVSVHPPWRKFENFYADMGPRPAGTSLDRYPNQAGNYEPGNCRWATRKEQNNNMRTNRLVTAFGKSQTLRQWSDEIGIPKDKLRGRLRLGWSPEEALTSRK